MSGFEASIIIDGTEEASVYGEDKDTVLSQAGLYFSQYAQNFSKNIELRVCKVINNAPT